MTYTSIIFKYKYIVVILYAVIVYIFQPLLNLIWSIVFIFRIGYNIHCSKDYKDSIVFESNIRFSELKKSLLTGNNKRFNKYLSLL